MRQMIVPQSGVVITIATPAVITTLAAHGLTAAMPVLFQTTGALPTGLVAGTTYYVIAGGLTATAFEVAATIGGAAINTTGTQSGVHSFNRGNMTSGVEILCDTPATPTFLVTKSRNREVEFYTLVSQWSSVGAAVNGLVSAMALGGFHDVRPDAKIPVTGNTFSSDGKTATMTETQDIGPGMFAGPSAGVATHPRIINLTAA